MQFVFTFELFQFLHIVTLHPAGGGDVNRLINSFDVVLAFQTGNHHIKLKHTHRPDNQVVVGQRTEDLHRALFGQLNQSFQQLFLFQRITQTDTAEQFRCKVRDTGEFQNLTLSEGITNLNGAVVMQTDNITGIGAIHMRTVAGHKGQRIRNHHVFFETHLMQFHAFFIHTGDNAQERHAVTMFRIHIRLNFKDKPGEFIFFCSHFTDIRLTRHRCRCPGNQAVQHMIHPEVPQRGTEEDRCQFTGEEQLLIKFMGCTLYQFQLITQLFCQLFADSCIQIRVIQPFYGTDFLDGMPLAGLIQISFIAVQVINPFEQLTAADRPGDWRTGNLQLVFHFIQ